MSNKFFIKLEEMPDGSVSIETKTVGTKTNLAVLLGQSIINDINRRSANAQAAAEQIINQLVKS